MSFVNGIFAKITSFLLVISITLTYVAGDFAYAYAALPAPSPSLYIPYELGQIVDEYDPSGKGPDVVLIKDLHVNYEVQRNIQDIIALIGSTRRISRIGLEGDPSGIYIDTSIISTIPDADLRERVLDYFMRKGMVRGAEGYAISNENSPPLVGIEDEELYGNNLSVLLSSLNSREKTVRVMHSIREILEEAEKSVLSPDLRRLRSQYALYKQNRLSPSLFHRYLTEWGSGAGRPVGEISPEYARFISVYGRIEQINESRVQREYEHLLRNLNSERTGITGRFQDIFRQAAPVHRSLVREIYSTGAYPNLRNYIECMDELRSINTTAMVAEENRVYEKIAAALCRTQSERDLIFVSDYMQILIKFLLNQTTRRDLDFFYENAFRFENSFRNLQSVQGSRMSRLDGYLQVLTPYVEEMAAFYGMARTRDEYFVNNFAGNDPENNRVSVMVVGGFHSDGVTEILRDKGISFSVIVPRVREHTPVTIETYYRFLRGERLLTHQELVDERLAVSSFFPKEFFPVFVALRTQAELIDLHRELSGGRALSPEDFITRMSRKVRGWRGFSGEFDAVFSPSRGEAFIRMAHGSEQAALAYNGRALRIVNRSEADRVFDEETGRKIAERLIYIRDIPELNTLNEKARAVIAGADPIGEIDLSESPRETVLSAIGAISADLAVINAAGRDFVYNTQIIESLMKSGFTDGERELGLGGLLEKLFSDKDIPALSRLFGFVPSEVPGAVGLNVTAPENLEELSLFTDAGFRYLLEASERGELLLERVSRHRPGLYARIRGLLSGRGALIGASLGIAGAAGLSAALLLSAGAAAYTASAAAIAGSVILLINTARRSALSRRAQVRRRAFEELTAFEEEPLFASLTDSPVIAEPGVETRVSEVRDTSAIPSEEPEGLSLEEARRYITDRELSLRKNTVVQQDVSKIITSAVSNGRVAVIDLSTVDFSSYRSIEEYVNGILGDDADTRASAGKLLEALELDSSVFPGAAAGLGSQIEYLDTRRDLAQRLLTALNSVRVSSQESLRKRRLVILTQESDDSFSMAHILLHADSHDGTPTLYLHKSILGTGSVNLVRVLDFGDRVLSSRLERLGSFIEMSRAEEEEFRRIEIPRFDLVKKWWAEIIRDRLSENIDSLAAEFASSGFSEHAEKLIETVGKARGFAEIYGAWNEMRALRMLNHKGYEILDAGTKVRLRTMEGHTETLTELDAILGFGDELAIAEVKSWNTSGGNLTELIKRDLLKKIGMYIQLKELRLDPDSYSEISAAVLPSGLDVDDIARIVFAIDNEHARDEIFTLLNEDDEIKRIIDDASDHGMETVFYFIDEIGYTATEGIIAGSRFSIGSEPAHVAAISALAEHGFTEGEAAGVAELYVTESDAVARIRQAEHLIETLQAETGVTDSPLHDRANVNAVLRALLREPYFDISRIGSLADLYAPGILDELPTLALRPTEDNAIDRDLAERWREMHAPTILHELAGLISENLQHVTREEFEKELSETISRFQSNLGDRPFAVILLGEHSKSAGWVLRLARDMGLLTDVPRERIIDADQRGASDAINRMLASGEVEDILVLDDASYSGSQVTSQVRSLKIGPEQDLRLHIGIPFITSHAETVVQRMAEGTQIIPEFHGTRRMTTILEVVDSALDSGDIDEITADRFRRILKVSENIGEHGHKYPDVKDPALVYFAHKVADHFSFPAFLRWGKRIAGWDTVTRSRLVPETTPPYKPEFIGLDSPDRPAWMTAALMPAWRRAAGFLFGEEFLERHQIGMMSAGVLTETALFQGAAIGGTLWLLSLTGVAVPLLAAASLAGAASSFLFSRLHSSVYFRLDEAPVPLDEMPVAERAAVRRRLFRLNTLFSSLFIAPVLLLSAPAAGAAAGILLASTAHTGYNLAAIRHNISGYLRAPLALISGGIDEDMQARALIAEYLLSRAKLAPEPVDSLKSCLAALVMDSSGSTAWAELEDLLEELDEPDAAETARRMAAAAGLAQTDIGAAFSELRGNLREPRTWEIIGIPELAVKLREYDIQTLRQLSARQAADLLFNDLIKLRRTESLEPGDTVQGYTIQKLLGEGTYGSVFQAVSRDGTAVALKTQKTTPRVSRTYTYFTYESLKNLAVEAGILRTIAESEQVAPEDKELFPGFYDAFYIHEKGAACLVMELFDPSTLWDINFADNRKGLREILTVSIQMLRALEVLNQIGMSHNDFKPGNILIKRTVSDIFARLIDFGAATRIDVDKAWTVHPVIGTQGYKSPEAEAGYYPDSKSDIYSFGVVLEEILESLTEVFRSGEIPRDELVSIFSSAMSQASDAWRPAMMKAAETRPDAEELIGRLIQYGLDHGLLPADKYESSKILSFQDETYDAGIEISEDAAVAFIPSWVRLAGSVFGEEFLERHRTGFMAAGAISESALFQGAIIGGAAWLLTGFTLPLLAAVSIAGAASSFIFSRLHPSVYFRLDEAPVSLDEMTDAERASVRRRLFMLNALFSSLFAAPLILLSAPAVGVVTGLLLASAAHLGYNLTAIRRNIAGTRRMPLAVIPPEQELAPLSGDDFLSVTETGEFQGVYGTLHRDILRFIHSRISDGTLSRDEAYAHYLNLTGLSHFIRTRGAAADLERFLEQELDPGNPIDIGGFRLTPARLRALNAAGIYTVRELSENIGSSTMDNVRGLERVTRKGDSARAYHELYQSLKERVGEAPRMSEAARNFFMGRNLSDIGRMVDFDFTDQRVSGFTRQGINSVGELLERLERTESGDTAGYVEGYEPGTENYSLLRDSVYRKLGIPVPDSADDLLLLSEALSDGNLIDIRLFPGLGAALTGELIQRIEEIDSLAPVINRHAGDILHLSDMLESRGAGEEAARAVGARALRPLIEISYTRPELFEPGFRRITELLENASFRRGKLSAPEIRALEKGAELERARHDIIDIILEMRPGWTIEDIVSHGTALAPYVRKALLSLGGSRGYSLTDAEMQGVFESLYDDLAIIASSGRGLSTHQRLTSFFDQSATERLRESARETVRRTDAENGALLEFGALSSVPEDVEEILGGLTDITRTSLQLELMDIESAFNIRLKETREELGGRRTRSAVKDAARKVIDEIGAAADTEDDLIKKAALRYLWIRWSRAYSEYDSYHEHLSGDIALEFFQALGVRFALERQRGIIGDDMGTGKTLQALAAALSSGARDIFVVAPKSAKGVWAQAVADQLALQEGRDELIVLGSEPYEHDTPLLRSVHGRDSVNDFLLRWSAGELPSIPGRRIILTNYDQFQTAERIEMAAGLRPGYMILDEAHNIRNPLAKRSRALMNIVSTHGFLALTGTPFQNRIEELYPLFRLIMEGLPEAERDGFRFSNEREFAAYFGSDRLESLSELHRLVHRFMMRREIDEVLSGLPEVNRTDVLLDPLAGSIDYRGQKLSLPGASLLQGWLYDYIHDNFDSFLGPSEAGRGSLMWRFTRLLRLRQASVYPSGLELNREVRSGMAGFILQELISNFREAAGELPSAIFDAVSEETFISYFEESLSLMIHDSLNVPLAERDALESQILSMRGELTRGLTGLDEYVMERMPQAFGDLTRAPPSELLSGLMGYLVSSLESILKFDSVNLEAVKAIVEAEMQRKTGPDGDKPVKVVVMSTHRSIGALAEALAKYGAVYIDGSVPADERPQLVESFQNDPGTRVFIGTYETVSESIQLTEGDVLIEADKHWNPAKMNQAEARLRRRDDLRNYPGRNIDIVSLLYRAGEEIESAPTESIRFAGDRSISAKVDSVLFKKNLLFQLIINGNFSPGLMESLRSADNELLSLTGEEKLSLVSGPLEEAVETPGFGGEEGSIGVGESVYFGAFFLALSSFFLSSPAGAVLGSIFLLIPLISSLTALRRASSRMEFRDPVVIEYVEEPREIAAARDALREHLVETGNGRNIIERGFSSYRPGHPLPEPEEISVEYLGSGAHKNVYGVAVNGEVTFVIKTQNSDQKTVFDEESSYAELFIEHIDPSRRHFFERFIAGTLRISGRITLPEGEVSVTIGEFAEVLDPEALTPGVIEEAVKAYMGASGITSWERGDTRKFPIDVKFENLGYVPVEDGRALKVIDIDLARRYGAFGILMNLSRLMTGDNTRALQAIFDGLSAAIGDGAYAFMEDAAQQAMDDDIIWAGRAEWLIETMREGRLNDVVTDIRVETLPDHAEPEISRDGLLDSGLNPVELRYLGVLLAGMNASERRKLESGGFGRMLSEALSRSDSGPLPSEVREGASASYDLSSGALTVDPRVFGKLGMLSAISPGLLGEVLSVITAYEQSAAQADGDAFRLAEGYLSRLGEERSVDATAVPVFFNHVLFTDLMQSDPAQLRDELLRLLNRGAFRTLPIGRRSEIIDRVVSLNEKMMGEARQIRPVDSPGWSEVEGTYAREVSGIGRLVDAILGFAAMLAIDIPSMPLRISADIYAGRGLEGLRADMFLSTGLSGRLTALLSRARGLLGTGMFGEIVPKLDEIAFILYAS